MTTVVGLLMPINYFYCLFFHPKMCPGLDNKPNGLSSSNGNGPGPEVEDLHFTLEPSTHLQSGQSTSCPSASSSLKWRSSFRSVVVSQNPLRGKKAGGADMPREPLLPFVSCLGVLANILFGKMCYCDRKHTHTHTHMKITGRNNLPGHSRQDF